MKTRNFVLFLILLSPLQLVGQISGTGNFGSSVVTTNCLGKFLSPYTIGSSSVCDNGTTVTTTEPISAGGYTSTGTTAGIVSLTNNATPGVVIANSWGWDTPATITTSWYGRAPNASPTANQIMLFPAPTSNASQWTWTTFSFSNLTDHTTPALGAATATSINKIAFTAPTTAGTIAFGADNSTATLPNGTVTLTVASGTVSLGTTTVNTGTCSSAITATATGVATTDVITATANADPTAVTGYTPATTGTLYVWAWPTSDNVNFKLCNNTTSNITPGSAVTLNWRVTR